MHNAPTQVVHPNLPYSVDNATTTTITNTLHSLQLHPPPALPTPPASTRVLHLPELLETILLHLPQKDLLLSQRVNQSFRHTILSSIRLQRALFLAPDWKRLESSRGSNSEAYNNGRYNACRGRKPENNRLLLRAFPGCYPTVTLVIVSEGGGGGGGSRSVEGRDGLATTTTSTTTPITRRGRRRQEEGEEHWTWDVCISFPATVTTSTTTACSPTSSSSPSTPSSSLPSSPTPSSPSSLQTTSSAVLYPEASWRRMFLSQPPCTNLHLVRRWQRSLHPAIVRERGIRMGEFVECALLSGRVGGDKDGVGRGGDMLLAGDVGEGGTGDGQRGGVGGGGEWHRSFIGSDRDWHFEGNIRCERVVGDGEEEGDVERTKAEEFTMRWREYLFSRNAVRV